jgi:hypothetical protein
MNPKYIFLFFLLTTLFVSCDSGYNRENGEWVWVSYDEAVGRRITRIDSYDNESFQVLSNEDYAKDKNNIFYIGRTINGADTSTFEVLTDNGYAVDKRNVFLDWDKVIFANPKTFEVLEFPYSKDENRVFCGTLPLDLNNYEVKEFKVTNEDEIMSGMKSSIHISHFIKQNPEYIWLETLEIDGVIVGEWATGETKKRKFKGFKEIK